LNARRWKEIQVSFDEMVDLDANARAERLATLASTDPELHRDLEWLLRADADASERLAPNEGILLGQPTVHGDPLGLTGRTIGHFDVREPLGAGGMGVVYRADDRRLGRAVALKFLLPHYSLDGSAKARFLREAHSAAALNHPNLCTVHEVGTSSEGLLFLVMTLYPGETLRERLTRDGAMPVHEALDIARQIAEGLRAAHAAGIVHRDLKLGNVMLLPDGTVRILDFGLAKAQDQSLTETGMLFGTVSYMSPEQIRGERVDGRADLWALGVVLYEMLTGRKPFGANEELATAHAILHADPELLSSRRGDLSAAIEGLVLRLLQKDPAKRYASAAELLRDLAGIRTLADGPLGLLLTRWRHVRRRLRGTLRPAPTRVLLGFGGVAVLAMGYFVLRADRQPATGSTDAAADPAPSIAVLPFANVGGDSTNLPFSDGFADELTTALGKIGRLSVMAHASAFSLKGKGLDAREIGRQLHVQYIVDGSVRRAANRRRVSANLIDVASGKELWSDTFEHDALNRDVFTVQDSVTRSIVRQLLPHISSMTVTSRVNRPTESPEAHELYLQGRYFFERRDSASLTKAQDYFQRAIRSDSTYALAYAGLADAYSHQATFGFALPTTNFPKAKIYASRAIDHDNTLVEVHTSQAFIALFYDWDWPAAGREFETAFRLNDRYAPAHLFHAFYFIATDSVGAAISEMHRAVDLDPFSALNNTRLISILFYSERYTDALAQARKVFERDSSFGGVRQELARAYVYLGRCAEALAVLEHSQDQPLLAIRGVRGYTYAKCGRRAQAVAELDRLRDEARRGMYVSHYALAVIEAGLGHKDQVIVELEKAYVERPALFLMKREPAFAALHSDPRFVALVRKVGLPM
jgi:eukaryotic-like serine/threonine-protein kinase